MWLEYLGELQTVFILQKGSFNLLIFKMDSTRQKSGSGNQLDEGQAI